MQWNLKKVWVYLWNEVALGQLVYLDFISSYNHGKIEAWRVQLKFSARNVNFLLASDVSLS